jgi:signal transduction histidine kinase
VRRRLALAIAGVAAAAVVLFAAPLAISLRQVYRDEDLLRLERDAVAATRRIDVSPHRSDPIELPRTNDRPAVYDSGGRLIAGRAGGADRGLAAKVLATGQPAVRTRGDQLLAAVPLLSGERVTGVYLAERTAAAAAEDTRRAWLLLGGLALAVMLVALAAAVLLGRGLSRPLERLVGAARRLGMGDFSVRAPRSSVPEVDAVGTALNATAGRLGDLVARERSFSADASHQLRTPLAALRIELEAAELRGIGADPGAALVQVDRLEQTIETLLSVTRDSQRPGTQTDVLALADELDAEWRPRLAGEGRPLRLDLGDGPLYAAAHEGVVREILGVLLDNAMTHGAGAVTLAVTRHGEWLRVEVRDEGPGFGDDAEHAFERGATGSGHGIGLALARSLAHAEGGGLAVSAPGPGPTIALMLRPARELQDDPEGLTLRQ